MAGSLLALDPGLRVSGVSVWHDGRLKWAGLVRGADTGRGAPAWREMANSVGYQMRAVLSWVNTGWHLDKVAVELMQSYDAKHQAGDQNDLIELAGVAGAVVGLFADASAVSYTPREHKGQVPKEVHNARVQKKLTPEERAAVEECAPSLMHNVWDAVGIGLFQLGRLKGTVKPR